MKRKIEPPRGNVALTDISVGEDRLRKLDPNLVDTLADSMRERGQLQPISIRHRQGKYELISGLHRLEAARKLGWKTVRAEIDYKSTTADMLLAEIDENLMRGELSEAERAIHVAKRKELYDRINFRRALRTVIVFAILVIIVTIVAIIVVFGRIL
jgi:ParB/RepB/Spo0J family partition protein